MHSVHAFANPKLQVLLHVIQYLPFFFYNRKMIVCHEKVTWLHTMYVNVS